VTLRDVTVAVNRRLRVTSARYKVRERSVEVAVHAATSTAFQRILVHELAHAAAVEMHGPRVRPHGKEWRALVAAAEHAGLIRKGRHSRVNKRAKPRRSRRVGRYLHTCPVCQFSRTARRRVTTWRCPECRAAGLAGTLTIERLA
jgi:predicted SprT family Zn-dependent metalloprotease